MKELCADLRAEYDALGKVGVGLTPVRWQAETDFYRWSVWDEIAHLLFFDEFAVIAVTDLSGFRRQQAQLEGRLLEGLQISEITRQKYAGLSGAELVDRWSGVYDALVRELEVLEPRARLPWFGPDMSARSFATARLMETWAHGQDVHDALGLSREPTQRLKHVAHIGVVTFHWSFQVRGLKAAVEAPAVTLRAPSGELWRWNENSRNGEVQGSALDFCLVVTQRRNVADTRLKAIGPVASQWLSIAQCFAGPPAEGPAPGSHPVVSVA